MTWFGTDVMALACIVGGAAAGGATTLAMRAHDGHRHVDCAVEARAMSPQVIVSSGGRTGTIVVTPDLRVHSRKKCGAKAGEIVEIHVGKHLRHVQELGSEIGALEIEGLEKALEYDLQFSEGLESEFAFQFQQNVEAEIQAEMERVSQQLQKLEKVRHR